MTARERAKSVLEKMAQEIAREAWIQGFEAGEERGQTQAIEYGQRARLLSGRQIADNEWPAAPINGHATDGIAAALDEAGIALVDAKAVVGWGVENERAWLLHPNRTSAQIAAGNVVNTGRIRAYYAGDPETVSPPEGAA